MKNLTLLFLLGCIVSCTGKKVEHIRQTPSPNNYSSGLELWVDHPRFTIRGTTPRVDGSRGSIEQIQVVSQVSPSTISELRYQFFEDSNNNNFADDFEIYYERTSHLPELQFDVTPKLSFRSGTPRNFLQITVSEGDDVTTFLKQLP